MARPVLLQNSFAAGMKRDFPRNRMPRNSVWDATDVILNYGAPIRRRGGWANYSDDLSSIQSATYIRGGIYAIFSPAAGGSMPQNLCIDENGWLYDITTVTVSLGQARVLAQNPIFHGGTASQGGTIVYTGLIIIPDGLGQNVPMKYDGTALTPLNGTPPKARYATVYKDFTLLGNGTVDTTLYPNRTWFSPDGDPDVAVSGAVVAWDTTDSWIDFSLPVKGYGATKNACLVFHDAQVSRIRGSTPPPDEDMVVDDPLFKIGLLDTFSITEFKDNIYWCAPEGVFRSDGVVLDDLTKKGGMLRHWLDLVRDASPSWTFSTGIQRDTLFISVLDGDTFRDAFMVDLQNLVWTRLSNVGATSFWSGQFSVADELYWGRRDTARVARLSTIYDVGDSALKNDGNNDPVLHNVETSFNELGRPGLKRLRRAFVGAEVTDYATDNPSVTIGYITTPEETAYTNAGSITESTEYDRISLPLNTRARGVAFKFQGSGPGDFLLHDIGVEVIPQEESKIV